jgi:hypothetical protein
MKVKHRIHRFPPVKFPKRYLSLGEFSEKVVENFNYLFPKQDFYYVIDTNSIVTRVWIYNKRDKITAITMETIRDEKTCNVDKFKNIFYEVEKFYMNKEI